MTIVSLLWLLPVLIVTLLIFGVAIGIGVSGGTDSTALIIGLVLLALLIVLIACLIVVLFLPMGVVRFARTGSISEALRFTEIARHIGTIGWGWYIIALVVLLVAVVIFSIITTILSLIPVIGWVLALVVTPLLTVFIARYYTLIYEQGEQQPVVA